MGSADNPSHEHDVDDAMDSQNRFTKLSNYLEPNKEMKILDLGCGNGKFILKLSAIVKELIGIDGHEDRIQSFQDLIKSQNLSNTKAFAMDAHKLDFADESFDAITCHSAFHHFSNGEKVLQEIARTLKKGGIFVVNDRVSPDLPAFEEFITNMGKLRDSTYQRTFTKLDWERLLRENGMALEALDVTRLPVYISNWLGKSNLNQAQKDKILDYLASAPLDAKEYFQIEISDGAATKFDNEGVWIKARKL